MELKISNEAFVDIESILQYSIETFGIMKAEEYLHYLYGKISKITKMPSIGHSHKQLPDDLKLYNVERHMVIYKVDGRGVDDTDS